jgi:ElaA protein
LDAQANLVEFYRSLGFEVTGPEFLEDGIPHVPMWRAGKSAVGEE